MNMAPAHCRSITPKHRPSCPSPKKQDSFLEALARCDPAKDHVIERLGQIGVAGDSGPDHSSSVLLG